MTPVPWRDPNLLRVLHVTTSASEVHERNSDGVNSSQSPTSDMIEILLRKLRIIDHPQQLGNSSRLRIRQLDVRLENWIN